MKIVGHFTESDKIKDELRNQNVLATDTPGMYHCAATGTTFNQDILDKMSEMGLFVYDNIEVEQGAIDDLVEQNSPAKKATTAKKIRIGIMIFLILLLVIANIAVMFFFK